jgi:hypothetical protein
MRLPVKVRYPRMTSMAMAPIRKGVSPPSSSQRKYLAVPTSPAARPPNACDSAVRCGTAVSGTFESGTPINVPIANATAIQINPVMCGSSSVPPIASDIPPTPAATPRRAVLGSLIQRSDMMKSAAAAR